MANLALIENVVRQNQSSGGSTAYETTQLVNSFLMTLIQHWDELENAWSEQSKSGLKWPQFTHTSPPQQSQQCLGHIRNALAHGCFAIEGENGEVAQLHLWTCAPPDFKKVEWDATITVAEMRQILACVVQFASDRNLPFRPRMRKGDVCR